MDRAIKYGILLNIPRWQKSSTHGVRFTLECQGKAVVTAFPASGQEFPWTDFALKVQISMYPPKAR